MVPNRTPKRRSYRQKKPAGPGAGLLLAGLAFGIISAGTSFFPWTGLHIEGVTEVTGNGVEITEGQCFLLLSVLIAVSFSLILMEMGPDDKRILPTASLILSVGAVICPVLVIWQVEDAAQQLVEITDFSKAPVTYYYMTGLWVGLISSAAAAVVSLVVLSKVWSRRKEISKE